MARGATTRPRIGKRIKDMREQEDQLFSLVRRLDSPNSITVAPLAGVAGGSNTGETSSNFLPTSGGTMIGPIAFFPIAVSINGSDEIDISEDPTGTSPFSSSYVIVSFATPDTLQLITGARFAGQQLWLQVPAASTLTIQDYSNNAGGNIVTSDGNDVVITTTTDPVTVTLIFDITLPPNGNTGGWVVLNAKAITGGSATASFPIQPPLIDHGTVGTETVDIDLSLTTGHAHLMTLDGDITLTFSNPPASTKMMEFELWITQDGTGGHTVTWPGTVANAPTLTETAGTVSAVTIHTHDAGSTYYAVVIQNASPSSGSFATKALDNLVSPVLNASIDFNSKAPTNFPGFTTPIVGQGFTITASGFAQALPTGDTYDWAINGVTIATLSAVGLGMSGTSGAGNIGLGENYMTIDDIAAPASPGVGQRRLFVDTSTGELSVRTTGGTTVSLEAAGSTSFADDVFDVHDETTAGKKLQFALENFFTGTHFIASTTTAARTWTLPDITGELLSTQGTQTVSGAKTFAANTVFQGDVDLGNAATDTITMTGDVDSNILPAADGTLTLGDTVSHWDDVFTETVSFRNGTGTETSTTKMYYTSDTNNLIEHLPTGDDKIIQVAGATKMQFTTTGASDEIFIRGGASRVIGFITDSTNVTLGTSGSIKIPVDGGSVGTAAAADTDFGDAVGCIGMYLNTIGSGNPTIVWKIDDGTGSDNRWVTLTISRTTGSLSGAVLT